MARSLFLLSAICLSAPGRAQDAKSYVNDVRPILAANCFACHGADEAAREAELRLDVEADRSNEESVAARAIVPGKPEGSELIKRITSDDPGEKMPPPDSGHSLTKQQIETLRQWIADGGKYESHWSFVAPVRPQLPPGDNDWCRSAIDNFVLQHLVKRKLKPSSQADPYMLIRRVYLDLTGLPPAPEAADAFAQNPSPEAFEKVVDQLLASPAFGEHWAAMWLDLARYADTKGYEKDQPRNIWRYRDWVIDAFNRDLPFDQFTREQIAGDLIANATTNQILATAFHRNTMTNDEGGTDNEEFRIAAVKDRVDTTIQVWMGLTMGCAKCHSHKYDPISQREYYQFMSFFNQTEDADRGDDAPRLPTPTTEQQQQQDEITEQLASLRNNYTVKSPEMTAAQTIWEDNLAGKPQWEILRVTEAKSQQGTTLKTLPDQSVLASGEMPPTDVYELTLQTDDFTTLTAIRIEAMTDPSLPQNGPGRNAGDPNFVLSELTAVRVDDAGQEVGAIHLSGAKADYSQNNWQVEKAIDGKQETGWAVSPKFGQRHNAIFTIAKPINVKRGELIRLKLSQQYKPNSLLMGRVRVYVSDKDPSGLDPNDTLSEVAATPRPARKPDQQQLLDEAFRKTYPATAEIAKQIASIEKQLADLKKLIVSTPVMRDLPQNKHRSNHIHIRGNFLEKGDAVELGFPVAFAAESVVGTNRLAVADWLMAPENPLTARVMVNRVWSRIFGRGIVETEEDFGTQGALPTHPQLLDWLAVEFRDTHKWSFKQLCKSIVMSATYQQTSAASERSKNLDPQNVWLSRGTRYRLSAEMVRDQSLAASGLLFSKIGGPSVMPPQPEGIWKATYSKLKWQTATGEDRYRRGIYTFVRRTSPYPSMITFDGTSREVCQIRRIRTNTPLQALVLLNDTVYVEASGALAKSVLNLPAADRLRTMFRRVLVRPPTDEETARVVDVYEDVKQRYAEIDKAKKLIKAANLTVDEDNVDLQELASLTMIASALLNLDETVSRP